MMYKAKVAVCSDIHAKHSTQSERHVEFLNVKTWWYVKTPLGFNLLATDFFFQILAPPVFKRWVIQKPNKVALWNKRHFEGEKMEIIQYV